MNLYEYINKWASGEAIYPHYKIDGYIDLISKVISKHSLSENISFIATGSKRNGTNINYMEFLIIYALLENNDKNNNTTNFKNSIFDILNESKNFDSIIELPDSLILEFEKEKILLKPSFKIIEKENIEAALINIDGEDLLYYPKLDNKNFDRKASECGDYFINLVRIFKYIIQSFSSEIKFLNEISFEISEALIWNIPNEYFHFKNYDDGIINALDYIYDSIAGENYMELSEINDIKILFSAKNNLNRKNILKALYELKKSVRDNI